MNKKYTNFKRQEIMSKDIQDKQESKVPNKLFFHDTVYPDLIQGKQQDEFFNNASSFSSVCLDSNICKYFDTCNIKLFGRDCADYENCQTWKYYEKYGTEGLFI